MTASPLDRAVLIAAVSEPGEWTPEALADDLEEPVRRVWSSVDLLVHHGLLTRDGHVLHPTDDGREFVAHPPRPQEPEMRPAETRILDALATAPAGLLPRAIAEATGLPKGTVAPALRRMLEAGRVTQAEHGAPYRVGGPGPNALASMERGARAEHGEAPSWAQMIEAETVTGADLAAVINEREQTWEALSEPGLGVASLEEALAAVARLRERAESALTYAALLDRLRDAVATTAGPMIASSTARSRRCGRWGPTPAATSRRGFGRCGGMRMPARLPSRSS